MYVYGGFMSPSPAYFDADVLPLLESGGVYVIAHVRGGAERGTAWYDAGRLFNKRNTYADLADVARYLPAHSYKLAAALQNTATGPGPYLLHAFAKSGHGIEGERQRSTAHALTFFFTQTGAPFVAQK